ncbi:restriction endonuclease subunit S [Staphylococcus petrasii]|uniref:restriction endonuclease subunit S n=1 Tax=Staphylococcus petrasii TaxID=1276936 RepID=UPI000CD02439|nr:restriction endonuclease subunit S [Staphylococcus petrasii]PNZ83625.1 restriction endonuclease subunit S [Staphylococcus petrasii]TGA79737.1 restriction endonuclease subunit S [Staphylococcus petrasii]SUN15191.1 putative restriction and modification system specificity protein [Staphylococcus petrasii]
MNPCLRFKDFKEDWKYDLFNELVTNKSKKFNPQIEDPTKDIELDSIEQNTGRILNTYMSNQFTSQKNSFNKGNVLYSKLRPYLNKYYYSQIDGVCSSEIWVLNTLNKKSLSNKFLYYFIQTNRFSSVANKSVGSKMPRADWELVKNIRLYKGSIEEQEKIGDFFSKLDRQIELEEEKLELLEQQKRGYMQKIFSQQLKFKDENGNDYPDWEETTLKNITNYISSKKSSNQYNESNNSKGYPVYDAIQEIGKDLQYDMEEPYISILKDGAGAGRLNLRAGKSSVIGTMGYIQANNVDIQFLYYRMKLLNFRKFIIGSTIPHLYYKDYSKEKILIPTSNDEQKKIGHFILNIDKLIDNKTLKLDYLKQRKQGLLQRMFI